MMTLSNRWLRRRRKSFLGDFVLIFPVKRLKKEAAEQQQQQQQTNKQKQTKQKTPADANCQSIVFTGIFFDKKVVWYFPNETSGLILPIVLQNCSLQDRT